MEQAQVVHPLERVIRQCVGVFCIGVWAIIGLIYWVPLLARSCGAYSGAVILAIIGGKPPNRKAARMLDAAANFYSKGFQDIRESVFSDTAIPDTEDENKQLSIFGSWDEFFRVVGVVGMETAIAILFWGSIIFLISHFL